MTSRQQERKGGMGGGMVTRGERKKEITEWCSENRMKKGRKKRGKDKDPKHVRGREGSK